MRKDTTKQRATLNVMIVALALFVMVIIGDNIHTSLTGAASDKQNYERHKKYYEEVIVPAKLDLYPARYYIKIKK